MPGQSHSLTKNLTDREYSNREIALTCLAAGILSAAAGYTRKNAFLATGTSVFIANRILYLDSKDKVETPMQILSFISFCSFLGLSLKQSWIKPPADTPSTWTHSLCKTAITLLALNTLGPAVIKGGDFFGEYTVKTLDEKSSTKLLIIGALTASAASTFLIPRLGYFISFAQLLSSIASSVFAMQTKESLNEALALAEKSVNYPLLLLLGASIGLLFRSLLGPKNYTPSLPLLAKIPLYSMVTIGPLIYASLTSPLSEEPSKIMAYSNSLFLKQSLNDGLLARFHCANERCFSSPKTLGNHISKNFPGLSNFTCNMHFALLIEGRHTPKRSIQQVQAELKTALDKIA